MSEPCRNLLSSYTNTFMQIKPTTSIFIDKYHPKTDGTCAISIRITFERKKKYYPTSIQLTAEDFNKTQSVKPREPYKSIALRLQAFEKKAADVIYDLPSFNWQVFERKYFENRVTKDTIKDAYDIVIENFKNAGQIGTAVNYECALKSLESYFSGKKFIDINVTYLKDYEKWMLQRGRSVTTLSMYLRTLRTLFNNEISSGNLTKEYYPFGSRKYEIPTGENVKKALPLSSIALIFDYPATPKSTTERVRDYWIFMYLCNGMNVKDFCLLKYENIKGETLEFIRAKTVRTKRKVEAIRVGITDDVIRIIKKWGNKNKDAKNYIFPILQHNISPERERQLIQQLTHVINDHLAIIEKDLKLDIKLRSYSARHSYATVLQRSGVSVEFISEALGHSDIKTTQNYLAGFEDDKKREVAKALTAFKKNNEQTKYAEKRTI